MWFEDGHCTSVPNHILHRFGQVFKQKSGETPVSWRIHQPQTWWAGISPAKCLAFCLAVQVAASEPQSDMNSYEFCGPSQSKRTGFLYTNLLTEPKSCRNKGDPSDPRRRQRRQQSWNCGRSFFLKRPLHSQEVFPLCRLHMLAWWRLKQTKPKATRKQNTSFLLDYPSHLA